LERRRKRRKSVVSWDYLESGNARGRIHIEELEGLVQRTGEELVAVVAELDHLHRTLVTTLL
jgi:hypothetical protein